ncbi:MAG: monoacylglycerol lipase [Chloroflexota bacterium]
MDGSTHPRGETLDRQGPEITTTGTLTSIDHAEGTFDGAGGTRLYYQRWLPHDARTRATVAIVHGFGEHGGRYMTVVNVLVPRGYAVYALDHRGHGRSPGPRGHISEWSEFRGDVRAFVNLVHGRHDEPLFLYGHSMGGLIVLDYGLHDPSGLAGAIVSGPLLAPPAISPALLLLGRVLSRVLPRFSMNSGLDPATLSRDAQLMEPFKHDSLIHSRGSARLSTEIPAAIARTQASAAHWSIPLLIIHGGDDAIVPPVGSRSFFERVPIADKEHHEYPGGYHEPHNDSDRDIVLADVANWLDRHSPALPT